MGKKPWWKSYRGVLEEGGSRSCTLRKCTCTRSIVGFTVTFYARNTQFICDGQMLNMFENFGSGCTGPPGYHKSYDESALTDVYLKLSRDPRLLLSRTCSLSRPRIAASGGHCFQAPTPERTLYRLSHKCGAASYSMLGIVIRLICWALTCNRGRMSNEDQQPQFAIHPLRTLTAKQR